MQTSQRYVINWIWLVWFYFISNYTRSAFRYHLWVQITFISYNIILISYLFECFLKAKLFYSQSIERQGPDMQDICNQWNMTGMISVKSYSVFWNYTFCKLWHSFSFNPHSIHTLIKDKVQTCKKSIINRIWLELFQLNRTQFAFRNYTFCKLWHSFSLILFTF